MPPQNRVMLEVLGDCLQSLLEGEASSQILNSLKGISRKAAEEGPSAVTAGLSSLDPTGASQLTWAAAVLFGSAWARRKAEDKDDAELRQHFADIADMLNAATDDRQAAEQMLGDIYERRRWVWARFSGADKAELARSIATELTATIAKTVRGPVREAVLEALEERFGPHAGGRRVGIKDPPKHFMGRDALVEEILDGLGSGVSLHGLRGMGGIGKTAIAYALAAKLKDEYPTQLQFDLKGATEDGQTPLEPLNVMTDALTELRPYEKLPDSEQMIEAHYRAVLAEDRGVLLLDNALDAKQVRPLLPPEGWVTLITSRQRFAIPEAGLKLRDVDLLEPDDAAALLAELVKLGGRTLTPEQVWELAVRLCGRLPLAIELAAGSLSGRDDVSPEAYISELEDEQERVGVLDRDESDTTRRLSVVIDMSLRLLTDEQRERFLELSVIPWDFNEVGVATVAEIRDDRGIFDIHAAKGMLSAFRGRSLLLWDANSRRYRLHDLVRAYTSGRVSSDRVRILRRRFVGFCVAIAELADLRYLEKGEGSDVGLRILDAELGGIRAALGWLSDAATSTAEAELLLSLLRGGAHTLPLRLSPFEMVEALEAGLRSAATLKDARAAAHCHGNLSAASLLAGNHDKALLHAQAYYDWAKANGYRASEGIALGHIGNVFLQMGQYEKAAELHERHLMIATETRDQRAKAYAMGNLAMAYGMSGQVDRALDATKEVVAAMKELGDRGGLATAIGNRGNLHIRSGNEEMALQDWISAVGLFDEIGDESGASDFAWNAGKCLAGRGLSKAARPLLERSLGHLRRVAHPEYASKLAEFNALVSTGD